MSRSCSPCGRDWRWVIFSGMSSVSDSVTSQCDTHRARRRQLSHCKAVTHHRLLLCHVNDLPVSLYLFDTHKIMCFWISYDMLVTQRNIFSQIMNDWVVPCDGRTDTQQSFFTTKHTLLISCSVSPNTVVNKSDWPSYCHFKPQKFCQHKMYCWLEIVLKLQTEVKRVLTIGLCWTTENGTIFLEMGDTSSLSSNTLYAILQRQTLHGLMSTNLRNAISRLLPVLGRM